MTEVLRDVLAPEMRVVFCGTAPGTASAKAQAYYAGPGNAFWQALHLTGLTPFELVPAEFEQLPEYGIGLTDICKVAFGSDAEVGTAEFDVGGLQEKIAAAEPGCLAFNGKNAARGALERDVLYGLQDETSAAPESGCCPRPRAALASSGRSSPGKSWRWPCAPIRTRLRRLTPARPRRASAR